MFNTPILFLVFNRPDTTARVFEEIRRIKPSRLYVAADGPREKIIGEAERCDTVRAIATKLDWPCQLETLFRSNNLGCKIAVSSAIDWFFEHEDQGIILEDDCLPHPDFFHFCDELLDRYANEQRVMAIAGHNFQRGIKRGDASYYFSQYMQAWGWASWRRAWALNDVELKFWPKWRNSKAWKMMWDDTVARKYWKKLLNYVYNGNLDTWDHQWVASMMYNNGLTATANVNLVSNIGFGTDATHTLNSKDPHAMKPVYPLGELTHPEQINQEVEADRFTFDHAYDGIKHRFPYCWLRLPSRAINYTRRLMKRHFKIYKS